MLSSDIYCTKNFVHSFPNRLVFIRSNLRIFETHWVPPLLLPPSHNRFQIRDNWQKVSRAPSEIRIPTILLWTEDVTRYHILHKIAFSVRRDVTRLFMWRWLILYHYSKDFRLNDISCCLKAFKGCQVCSRYARRHQRIYLAK